jgi:hypothetical protein
MEKEKTPGDCNPRALSWLKIEVELLALAEGGLGGSEAGDRHAERAA